MITWMTRLMTAALLLSCPVLASPALAQPTTDPYPTPIPATEGAITVNFREFASLPDVAGLPARPMLMLDEPSTRRLFVNDMQGALYSVSYDGKIVTPYLDHSAKQWELQINFSNFERGFQSFAFHPQFNQRGSRGYGKLYTYVDTSNLDPKPDFVPNGGKNQHDTVLLEWTARNPAAATYDGGAPRELMRWEQPFGNHNGGQLAFNPLAQPGSADYGLLYVGAADGGAGGDPLNNAQKMNNGFGKIMRIDPLGTNSANGRYGIPANNPFVKDPNPDTLKEIYALGARNPQRFCWDSKTGAMYMSDIGQGTVEEISPVTAGANLGWKVWEGNYKFIDGRTVDAAKPRSDPKMTYPVVEFGQLDPLLQNSSAAILGYVYRRSEIKPLANLLLFGDNPSGEMFYINADKLPPNGSQDALRRILLNDNGVSKTLLQVVDAKNAALGRKAAGRADLRYGEGPNGQIFILNKWDGVIRILIP